MIINKIALTLVAALIVTACNSSKGTVATTTTSSSGANSSASTVVAPLPAGKSADGIYAPGDEELSAIRVQYPFVTLDQLNEGHLLYTKGACVNCHKPESIYRYETGQWKGIIDDMAKKAGISDIEKDAVYKYVLAIKANQPK